MKNLEIELQKKIVENLEARLDLKLEARKKQHKSDFTAEKNDFKAEKDILKLAEKLRIEMRKYLKLTGDKESFEKFANKLWMKIK